MFQPEKIDAIGDWWVPTRPKSRFKGRLVFDEDGGRLTVYYSKGMPRLLERCKDGFTLQGIADKGTLFTLHPCSLSGYEGASGGIGEAEFVVGHVYRGIHLSHPDLQLLRSASTSFTYLNRWVAKSGMELKYYRTGSDFDLRYRGPKARRIKISDELSLELAYFPHYGVERVAGGHNPLQPDGKFEVQEQVYIRMVPHSPRTFDYYEGVIRILQDFFTLAMLRLSLPVDTSIEADFEAHRLESGHMNYPFGDVIGTTAYHDPDRDAPMPTDFLFREDDVRRVLPSLLRSWFSASDRTESARTLYTASLYIRTFLESRFLFLCQAVESYHRRSGAGGYMDRQRFLSRVLPKLKESVPDEIRGGFREAVDSRLSYLYEYSLNKRMKLLVAEHEPTLSVLIADPRALGREAVSARNSLVHDKPDSNDAAASKRLFVLCDFLKFLLELCFLKEMGLRESEVQDLLRKNHAYHRVFSVSRCTRPN